MMEKIIDSEALSSSSSSSSSAASATSNNSDNNNEVSISPSISMKLKRNARNDMNIMNKNQPKKQAPIFEEEFIQFLKSEISKEHKFPGKYIGNINAIGGLFRKDSNSSNSGNITKVVRRKGKKQTNRRYFSVKKQSNDRKDNDGKDDNDDNNEDNENDDGNDDGDNENNDDKTEIRDHNKKINKDNVVDDNDNDTDDKQLMVVDEDGIKIKNDTDDNAAVNEVPMEANNNLDNNNDNNNHLHNVEPNINCNHDNGLGENDIAESVMMISTDNNRVKDTKSDVFKPKVRRNFALLIDAPILSSTRRSQKYTMEDTVTSPSTTTGTTITTTTEKRSRKRGSSHNIGLQSGTTETTTSPSIIEETHCLLFPTVDKDDGAKEDDNHRMDDREDNRSYCNHDGSNGDNKDDDDDDVNGDSKNDGDDKCDDDDINGDGKGDSIAGSTEKIISISKETRIQKKSSTRTKERYFSCSILCMLLILLHTIVVVFYLSIIPNKRNNLFNIYLIML